MRACTSRSQAVAVNQPNAIHSEIDISVWSVLVVLLVCFDIT